jgi:hypothetical protein
MATEMKQQDIPDEGQCGEILGSLTRCLPGPYSVAARTVVTIILVRGAVGDYAAYIGAGSDLEFVRRYGNKLVFAEACAIFPALALQEERYRK